MLNTQAGECIIARITNVQNSLGALKIPARISQAQVSGLPNDLGVVRKFTMNIECKFFFYIRRRKKDEIPHGLHQGHEAF